MSRGSLSSSPGPHSRSICGILRQEGFALALGQAPQHAQDDRRAVVLPATDAAHPAQHLVLGVLANGARVVEDDIRLVGVAGEGVAQRRHPAPHELAVELVHLTTEGLQIDPAANRFSMVLARVHQWVHRRGLSGLLPWLLAAIGLAAYANSLAGPFIYDDAVGNRREPLHPPSVAAAGRARAAIGHPGGGATGRQRDALAVNYRIGGLDVRGYHAFNVVVHVLCGLLVFGIVRRTLAGGPQDRLRNGSAALAGACALLWMVHPIQTECVNYITQRSESVMALFFLLTLYCAIRAGGGRRSLPWSVAAVVSCGLGMASKEAMVTAPVDRGALRLGVSKRALRDTMAPASRPVRGPGRDVGGPGGPDGGRSPRGDGGIRPRDHRLGVCPEPVRRDRGLPEASSCGRTR